MKKEFKFYKLCESTSRILIVVFVVFLVRDYMRYNTALNSAPFYVFILANAAVTLLPAMMMCLLSKWLKNKDV